MNNNLTTNASNEAESPAFLVGAVMPSLPLDKILRLDQPYSLPEILKGLIDASDILLHKKDYDGHGWERLEYCYRHAKEVLALFEGNEA